MAEEQINFEEEEYGGAQKLQYQGSGAISALADEEPMVEDDEYDDLYDDVNVGEGFLQMHRSEAPVPAGGVGNGGLQAQKTDVPELRVQAGASQEMKIPGVSVGGNYSSVPEQKVQPPVASVPETQVRHMGFQGSTTMPSNVGADSLEITAKFANEPLPSMNSGTTGPSAVTQLPANQMNMKVNLNRPMANENQIRPPIENGSATLFVGDLHWWTTDAELESVLSQFGRVKEIKFFDERASGKSKGYCQVDFYDPAAASACKEGMDGYVFNGRACVVAFATSQTLKQMGANYVNKSQGQVQTQPQGRRPMNDGAGRGGGMNFQGGDTGRNFGRGNWGRGGQGVPNRGPGGPGRGRGGAMGAKNMVGNNAGVGAGANGGGYGQGLAGPGFGGPVGGMMNAPGMMGPGFDPTYMGRGGGYGGFPGPGFPGMLPQFPGVNAMGLAGVAPHVNPAFFGRGMATNGMGMMGSSGMEGHHAPMWNDPSMGGWGGEEQDRRTRESSYGGDDGASEYGNYVEANHEKSAKSSAASRERERGSEREWTGTSERRHRDEREQDLDRSEREHREPRYKEEKDSYRDHRRRERDVGYDDDWDRGQSSSRPRSRSKAMPEDDHRSRSRDVDYGKRRRLPSE
ncbi:putative nucleotide-binding alpha-beta plait domain-containing protein [Rosa chinensis]|uniref:Putative nucleotide-binding alpha-beta plait domain-containing protein n=1 Tax=Rosa chinensis TaxID=74649 RepID=A0A2P6R0Y7_ROSCH|nr:cleavage and polyadenylation specificity factor subunit 6 [Rosa chinensis]XP_024192060.1 cleavage and polyadenylation specificity factor subunit 6 [Rosa chinensis]XP_040373922.1 cleavage and polyadenylation specificity factor subunit 6 [Rosa chinensis]PRQ40097.1 putative nucleotide-binding alpha-beta plait domain-containing protein [Rosa chinensis]